MESYSCFIYTFYKLKFHQIDNELSKNNQKWLDQKEVGIEIVPPYNHRRNAAERAIRTFKNHFIAGLSTTHPEFPLHLWEDLIEQAVITINLLRSSRIHPQLSAYHSLMGMFDYN